jgi:hypothetical protein
MLERARSRLLENPGLGSTALERLRAARVAVVGLGTLGGPLALHLGLLGTNLLLVDPGTVEAPNLAAQLFSVSALGRPKVEARAAQARALGADGAFAVRPQRIEALGAGEFAGFDLVVSALDALRPRVHLGELCQRLSVPMLDLAVDGSGERLHARLASFDSRAPDPACVACRYDARALEAIRREDQPATCPSWRAAPESAAPPTLQTSAMAGVVAGLGALHAVRVLLDPPGTHAGHVLRVDCDVPERIHHSWITRSAHCAHLPPFGRLREVHGRTLAALLAQAGSELGAAPEWLELPQRSLVLGLRCRGCGAERPLLRCAEAIAADELRCAACASSDELEPIGLSRCVPVAALRGAGQRSWNELGFPQREVVGLRSRAGLAHYLLPAEETTR